MNSFKRCKPFVFVISGNENPNRKDLGNDDAISLSINEHLT